MTIDSRTTTCYRHNYENGQRGLSVNLNRTPDSDGVTTGAFAEVDAMRNAAAAIEPLPAEGRTRVLNWLNQFFRHTAGPLSSPTPASLGFTYDPPSETQLTSPSDLAELFAVANPKTEADKVLVVGYWMLKHQGSDEFESMTVNSQLTHLGHRVTNVTRALTALMTSRPVLVVQTYKSGKSRQARKKYKLTLEGSKRVENLMRTVNNEP
jgi:hypothetical protein